MKNKSKSLMNVFISMFAVFAIVITFSLQQVSAADESTVYFQYWMASTG